MNRRNVGVATGVAGGLFWEAYSAGTDVATKGNNLKDMNEICSWEGEGGKMGKGLYPAAALEAHGGETGFDHGIHTW